LLTAVVFAFTSATTFGFLVVDLAGLAPASTVELDGFLGLEAPPSDFTGLAALAAPIFVDLVESAVLLGLAVAALSGLAVAPLPSLAAAALSSLGTFGLAVAHRRPLWWWSSW
jgi:hypothetical protein